MGISPQLALFVLFMFAVVQATRIDEARQKRQHQRATTATKQEVPRESL